MKSFSRLLAPVALTLGFCLLAAPTANAARGGGGGRGSGGYHAGHGGGYGGGYHRGYEGYGRGGYGYGRGGYGYGGYGYGWGGFYPGFGIGIGYGYPGYGYADYPAYSSYSPTYYSTPMVYSTPTYSTPAVVYADPAVSTQQSAYFSPAQPNLATVEVRVPADATVWIEGSKTKQTGDDRLFESPPLEQGRNYSYDIKAEWMKDGRMITRTQTLQVQAGKRSVANFN